MLRAKVLAINKCPADPLSMGASGMAAKLSERAITMGSLNRQSVDHGFAPWLIALNVLAGHAATTMSAGSVCRIMPSNT